jgi:hypothetical protein
MFRILTAASIVLSLFVMAGAAQTQTGTALTASTPQENAGGGGVSQRSPGTWIRAALARHNTLKGLRVNGPRFGQQNTTEVQAAQLAAATGNAATTTGGLGGLLDLVNQFTGGSGANLGNLTNLLGNLTGGSSTTTGGTSTTTGSTTSGGTNYTLADLIAMGQAAGGTQKSSTNAVVSQPAGQTASANNSTARTINGNTFGGAIGRLPKPEERFQTATTTTTQPASTPKFGTRWVTAMTSTFFNAIALGMQSDAFITALENALRPLILPQSSGSSNSGTGSGSGSGSGTTTGGTTGGSTTGGGIENLPASGGSTGGSGSTI